MYHLAERVSRWDVTSNFPDSADVLKFNIVPLKGAAFAEYLLHISEKNIVHELFSDFTWRYVVSFEEFLPY